MTRFVLSNEDPMSILRNTRAMIDTSADSAYSLLDLGGLFYLIRTYGLVFGAVALVIELVMFAFVKQSNMLAEKKQDIMHKLIIIFLIVNAVPLMSAVMKFFVALT